jgi:hypothetical protein
LVRAEPGTSGAQPAFLLFTCLSHNRIIAAAAAPATWDLKRLAGVDPGPSSPRWSGRHGVALGLDSDVIVNDVDRQRLRPNGSVLASELRKLGADVDDVILNRELQPASSCDASCETNPTGGDDGVGWVSAFFGITRHLRWPVAWNPKMLDYLRQYPLPQPTPAFLESPAIPSRVTYDGRHAKRRSR